MKVTIILRLIVVFVFVNVCHYPEVGILRFRNDIFIEMKHSICLSYNHHRSIVLYCNSLILLFFVLDWTKKYDPYSFASFIISADFNSCRCQR